MQMGRPISTHRIQDYGINYLAFLLTQVMGNGITSLDTMMGMFGLGVHSGLHREWTYIARELGAAEQKRANKIQHQNLLIEIAATKSWHAAMATAQQQSLSPPAGYPSIPNIPPFSNNT